MSFSPRIGLTMVPGAAAHQNTSNFSEPIPLRLRDATLGTVPQGNRMKNFKEPALHLYYICMWSTCLTIVVQTDSTITLSSDVNKQPQNTAEVPCNYEHLRQKTHHQDLSCTIHAQDEINLNMNLKSTTQTLQLVRITNGNGLATLVTIASYPCFYDRQIIHAP